MFSQRWMRVTESGCERDFDGGGFGEVEGSKRIEGVDVGPSCTACRSIPA